MPACKLLKEGFLKHAAKVMVSTKNQLTIKIDRNTLPTNSHFYEIYGEILLAHI